jgi:5'(3')-deoxyribonucleotidase
VNISLDLDGVICQAPKVPLEKEKQTWVNYDRLAPVPGAKEGIAELSIEHWLTVITARHYRGAQEHVEEWLEDYQLIADPISFKVVAGIATHEKWRVIQALETDIHVDDYVKSFTNVPSSIITILFKGDHNRDQDWPLTVSSWPELVTKIKEMRNEQ